MSRDRLEAFANDEHGHHKQAVDRLRERFAAQR
jgi:hypothetical protein